MSCVSVCVGLIPKDLQTILSRLAAIEVQLKQQSQMLQALLNASQTDSVNCDLPSDISLPVQSMSDLQHLEDLLEARDTRIALVNKAVISVSLLRFSTFCFIISQCLLNFYFRHILLLLHWYFINQLKNNFKK